MSMGSSFRHALGWCGEAFKGALTPASSPFAPGNMRLCPQDDRFLVFSGDGAEARELEAGAPDKRLLSTLRRSGYRYLDLPEDDVIAVTVTLPSAVRGNIRDAIALRMEELTPFSEDEVFFDFGEPTELGNDLVSVPVFVTPKLRAEAWGGALARLRVRIDGIIATDVGDPEGGAFPVFDATRLDRRARRAGALLLAGAVFFAVAAGVFQHEVSERQDQAIARLEGSISDLLAELERARALEREIVSLTSSISRASARRSDQSTLLEVLEVISRVLPDSAYLTSFSWSERSGTVNGYAADASPLIKELELSDLLTNVRFSSPVSYDRTNGKDRFSIAFESERSASE